MSAATKQHQEKNKKKMPKIDKRDISALPAGQKVSYAKDAVNKAKADKMLRRLERSTTFEPERGMMYGKEWVKHDRQTAFFSRIVPGKTAGYYYAGKRRVGENIETSQSDLAKVVRACMRVAEREFGLVADTAIVTKYTVGGSLSFHADSERDIDQSAPIACITLTHADAPNELWVRAKGWKAGDPTYCLTPAHGSAYAFAPGMQATTKHAVRPGKGTRYSITLRKNK